MTIPTNRFVTIPWPQFLGLFRCFHIFWHLFCRFHPRPSPVSRLVSDGCVEMVPGCRPSFGTLGVLCGPTNWAARRQPIGQPIDVGWRWMTLDDDADQIWQTSLDMIGCGWYGLWWKTLKDTCRPCFLLLLLALETISMSSNHSLVSLLEKPETCEVMVLLTENVTMVKMKWQWFRWINHHFMKCHNPPFTHFFPSGFLRPQCQHRYPGWMAMQMSLKQQRCRGRLVHSGTDFITLYQSSGMQCQSLEIWKPWRSWRISGAFLILLIQDVEVSLQKDEVSRKWFLDFLATENKSDMAYGDLCLGQEESQPFDSDDHPDQRPQGRCGWEFGYGSIPINTIFSGMNIHLPAILMFTRGTRFWHTAIWW